MAEQARLQEWMEDAAAELGVTPGVGPDLVELLLDVARVAAHRIDRPAAPLTTFLVGYAAGRADATRPAADPGELQALCDRVRALAEAHPAADEA